MGRRGLAPSPLDLASGHPDQVEGEPARCHPKTVARIFSYTDAHRYRLGTHDEALPVNEPRCPVHRYHKDGARGPALL